MIELLFALQVTGLPSTVSEDDFAALQQCFAENRPVAGDNRCAPVDEGVARIEQCLRTAETWETASDCIEAPRNECWDHLHSGGTPANLLIRYCGVRQLAYLEVLTAEQWARARQQLSDADLSMLLELSETMNENAARRAATDDYELSRLTIPSSRLRSEIMLLEMAMRLAREQDDSIPL